jgi:DNA-binding MarR family transcriptional regulator
MDMIGRLARALEEFRAINPEMPSQVIATFLAVAQKPRITFKEIGELTGQSSSAANRNVILLAKTYGIPLVDYGRDPNDRRNNVAWLTPAGKLLTERLAAQAKGEE